MSTMCFYFAWSRTLCCSERKQCSYTRVFAHLSFHVWFRCRAFEVNSIVSHTRHVYYVFVFSLIDNTLLFWARIMQSCTGFRPLMLHMNGNFLKKTHIRVTISVSAISAETHPCAHKADPWISQYSSTLS